VFLGILILLQNRDKRIVVPPALVRKKKPAWLGRAPDKANRASAGGVDCAAITDTQSDCCGDSIQPPLVVRYK
jgi:hypothetical protein